MSPFFGNAPSTVGGDSGILLTSITSSVVNGGYQLTVTGTSAHIISLASGGILYVERSLDNVNWTAFRQVSATVGQILAGVNVTTWDVAGRTFYFRVRYIATNFPVSNTLQLAGTLTFTAITIALVSPIYTIDPIFSNPITFFLIRGTYSGVNDATPVTFQLFYDTTTPLAAINNAPINGLIQDPLDPNPAHGATNYWNFNSFGEPLHAVTATLVGLTIGNDFTNIAADLLNPSTSSNPVPLKV